jgi:hypothetical protein
LLTHVTNLHIVKLPTFIVTEVLVQLVSRTYSKDYSSKCHCAWSHRCEDLQTYRAMLPCLHMATTAFRGPGVRANCGLANRPPAFLRSLPRSHDAQWHVVVFTVTAKRDIVSIATTSRILSVHLTTTQLLNYYKTTRQLNDHESTGALKYLTTTSPSVYRSV